MANTDTVTRSLHDLGLAAWFGGSLMGAVGVNGAAREVDDPRQRSRVANAGWDRWAPVNMAAVGTHVAGSLLLARANRGRLAAQEGVAGATGLKAALTTAALAASAYSRVLGRRLSQAGDYPAEGGAVPSAETPTEIERALQRQRILQWVVPALTGSLLVMNALMGEQQRPKAVAGGLVRRVVPGL